MWKKIQERIFPFTIALSALSVSVSAAFYSISGLSKLFAGASLAVIIMASSLEAAKLVIASLLYQYRKTLPRLLKIYLSTACFVLILITSMGIYGFLSSAYQETAAKSGNIDAQIALVEVKRDNIKSQLVVYNEEKTSINKAITSLRSGLSNNVIQYTDTLGNVITTTSSSTRRALEKQLDQAIGRQSIINSKVDNLNEKLFDYETEIVEIKTSDSVVSELGPLKYISGLTGFPMDKIINWLLLIIIFVFDPLAIALVIAANYAFEQLKKKYKNNIYGEKIPITHDPTTDNTDKLEHWEESKAINLKPTTQEGIDSGAVHDFDLKNHLESLKTDNPTDEIEQLENQLLTTAKANKYGLNGWKSIKKRIKELKSKRDNNKDDLTIRY